MDNELSQQFDKRSVPFFNPKQKQRLNEYLLISLFAMIRVKYSIIYFVFTFFKFLKMIEHFWKLGVLTREGIDRASSGLSYDILTLN